MSGPSYIYHITTRNEWERALAEGAYQALTQAAEGFMHCSTAEQVPGVLERYYAGKTGLVKLCIDPERLTSPLIYELASSVNQVFPHIYGPLNTDAVVEVIDI